jgi:transcriptional regulator with XRE-family HTH domain
MRQWLKELRLTKKTTQQELANELDVSLSYYNQIENGERQKNLDLSLAAKLSELFEIPIEWIIQQESKLA